MFMLRNLLVVVLGLSMAVAHAGEPLHTFRSVEMAPIAAISLGDAVLVAPSLLERWEVEQGQAAELQAGDQRLEVLLYPIDRPEEQVSMKRALRDRLGVVPGRATVTLRLLSAEEATLTPVPNEVRTVPHKGTDAWSGIVLGAPHGDCDLYTAEVVEQTNKQCGVPAVTAYGGRVRFLSRWIDVNRPMQRRPRPSSYGILPYRDWTSEAAAVYADYRAKALRVGARSGEAEAAGRVPLDLYFDLHGHDLSVRKPSGESVYRNVFECMARGFSIEEVRLLKATFDRFVAEEYGDQAPPSYWGNLPEDRVYEYAGVEAGFFYSGLGARVYGILASDVARRGIHIESPNSMRISPEQRPRTAKVVARYLEWLRDELLPESLARQSVTPPSELVNQPKPWVTVPAGRFFQGAPRGEGWSGEWPQHWVTLHAYQIATTEVTVDAYAAFLNQALEQGGAEVRGGAVYCKENGHRWCLLWPAGPLALLEQQEEKITARAGRAHHPVNYVTWHGAHAMAEAVGARLPSESEWERAAGWDAAAERWLRTSIGQASYAAPIEAALMHCGGPTKDFASPATLPVGSFTEARSPVGCYDMAGNVWEWTADWYAKYDTSGEVQHQPTGPEQGTLKVLRGGAWDTEPSTATPTFRLAAGADEALCNVGFRLARDVTD